MYVAQYMTAEPIVVRPEMALPEAKKIMVEKKIRHLPVVDEEGKLIGIVTDRDLRSAYPSTVATDEQLLIAQNQVEKATLRQIMVKECTSISASDTLDDTLLVFDKLRVGALPVVNEQQKVIGIFSIRDLTSAYKKLFGMMEMGSVLLGIEDEGRVNCMSSIVLLLEEQGIPFSRLIRLPATDEENGKIYLRLNTFKLAKVTKLLQEAGFTLLKPEQL